MPMKPNIALKPIESSSIAAIGYDPATQTLGVQFKRSPEVHHYSDVLPKKWADLQAAESVGSFFASHVRNHHPHSVLTGETA